MKNSCLFLIFSSRIIVLFILINIFFSCNVLKKTTLPVPDEESELITTRKFAGIFLDFRTTVTDDLPRVDVIWIKTSLESRYGKICAFGKKCEFKNGDRLYLTKKFYSPGMVGGKWEYYIENDSEVIYQLVEYQSDKKAMTESWY